jgi:hypothetical protein
MHDAPPPGLEHVSPQPPQCAVLVPMLTSQPFDKSPSQLAKPELQPVARHNPPMQSTPVAWAGIVQALLHAPQWAVLVSRLVHALLPMVHCAPLEPHPTVHTPLPLQVSPKQHGELASQVAFMGRQQVPAGVAGVPSSCDTQVLPLQQ